MAVSSDDDVSIVIRPAKREDCKCIMQLVHELAVYEKAPNEVTVTLEHFTECGFGPDPVWWAYVAEVDGVIVGFALYYLRFSTWQGKKMYLEDILVTEQWRGKGIGTLLMDQLIKTAAEQEFPGITWQVLHWNEPAIKFYEKYKPKLDNEWINVMLNF